MIAAVILGGGLTLTASTPAWAMNNFIVNWVSVHGGGSVPFVCNHGMSYEASNTSVASYNNNCDVRVWVYDLSGNGQCISPDSNAAAQSAVIGRVYISTNSANC
jgi:hypothetical protein